MSLVKIKARIGENGRSMVLALLSVAAISISAGVASFIMRVDEVGVWVSLADAALVSSLLPLFLSAILFVYRRGGFDIFTFPFSRLYKQRAEVSDYYSYTKRERGGRGLALPLLAVGGVLFSFSVLLSFIQAVNY